MQSSQSTYQQRLLENKVKYEEPARNIDQMREDMAGRIKKQGIAIGTAYTRGDKEGVKEAQAKLQELKNLQTILKSPAMTNIVMGLRIHGLQAAKLAEKELRQNTYGSLAPTEYANIAQLKRATTGLGGPGPADRGTQELMIQSDLMRAIKALLDGHALPNPGGNE